MHVTEKRIEIRAPVERVFDLFSDFESFPRWMKNIREVRYTGRRFTRWAAEAPLGTEVEWEAETTHFEPARRIAWRSVRGDVDTEGEVVFEATRRGTTLVHVVLGYQLPAGRLGEMVARLFGKNPEQQLEDDLERFAAVAEGRRRGRERDEREHDGRRAFARRDRRGRDYDAAGDARPRADEEEEMPHWERSARAGFEEAIRAARRSQLEGRRRYAAERERRERERSAGHRYREEREYERDERPLHDEHYVDDRQIAFADERGEWRRRDAERLERDERWEDSPRRDDYRHDERDERRPRRPRHALTPRERERERARGRDPDYGYSEQAFRRGVEKLMDEPPSRRWRRWE